MSVKLNLRTVLAYLDDALEPAQARQVGERISENTQVQELIERIKTVARRRRLTSAPEAAKIDPNTIAEFLDGTLSAEQQAEFEQICLASDVHLAEVAACHQILAYAKGEPALVPPTAKQRMVRLLEDPTEATRPIPRPASNGDSREKPFNLDALLNNGRRYKSYALLGAGLLGGILLVVAVNQLLQMNDVPPVPEPIAKNKDIEEPLPEKAQDAPTKKAQGPEVKSPTPIEKPPEPPKVEKKVEPEVKTPDPEPKKIEPARMDIAFPAFEPPNPAPGQIGTYVAPLANQPTILLQAGAKKDDWRRLDLTKPEVNSGQALVSLPGCRSTIMLSTGIRLTLWGNLREVLPIALHESRIELHQNSGVDADLTLQRGRIVITNLREERAALVRVRFANPTNPQVKEFMDIRLVQKGAEVLIDRFSQFPLNEKFYSNPNDPNRVGPMSDMGVTIMSGDVELKCGDVTFGMEAPPGRAQLMWNSQAGLGRPTTLDKLPDWVLTSPPLFPSVDAQARNEMQRARDELSTGLSGKPVEIGLKEARNSADPFKRQLAVRSFGAIDDLRNLLDALEDKQPGVRAEANLTTRHWIAADRDNDYVFLDALKSKYTPLEAEKVMELLHNITDRQAAMPETYEFLIESLDNPRLIFRELARGHLYALVPAGRSIPYAADADALARRKAQDAWRQLIPPGQLPKQTK